MSQRAIRMISNDRMFQVSTSILIPVNITCSTASIVTTNVLILYLRGKDSKEVDRTSQCLRRNGQAVVDETVAQMSCFDGRIQVGIQACRRS